MEFLKNKRHMSFLYDGKDFLEFSPQKNITETKDGLVTEYVFKDGLKVTNIAKKYSDFDAYEWVTWFEMTGEKPSKIISELWDCDVDINISCCPIKEWTPYLPEEDMAMKIYSPNGSNWADDEFFCDADKLSENIYKNYVYLNDTKEYKNKGGRSSDGKAPFFNVLHKNKGVIFAIGWSGQWNCKITGIDEGINIKTKIEDTHFKVLPGEKFRTSSVVIMKYECDEVESHNKWRRFIKNHFSLIGSKGKDKYGPLCERIWGGLKTDDILKIIECIKEKKLPYEYLWIDAGWYGTSDKDSPNAYEGEWGNQTGDWRVNKHHHPDNFEEVSKALKNAGLKFLLWLEPERVINSTPIVAQHPEYFIRPPFEDANLLLNLGNEEAWQYCYNTLAELIKRLGINCYRQDFNFMPLEYWRKNDSADRKGISEIKHINGLYRLWDTLLQQFPDLIIDNCASGGRRIDIELLRRSIPLWRSDAYCPANYSIEMMQIHNMNYSTWIPYSGASSNKSWGDCYSIRSSYSGALSVKNLSFENDVSKIDSGKIEWLNKYLNEYIKVRPYFSCDFYPLTDKVKAAMEWCASQYNRPEKNDGIIQIFKRKNSPFKTAVFKLKGLDATKKYIFTDADNNLEFECFGETLMNEGLEITIKESRIAKLYFYKAN